VWKKKFYEKGREYEYNLMRKLKEMGYFVIRAPASGRAVKRFFYPDVIAIRKGRILLFEVKYRSKSKAIQIHKYVYKKMKEVEEKTGGKYYIAYYMKPLRAFRFLHIDDYDTEGEKYIRYRATSFKERGLRIIDFA